MQERNLLPSYQWNGIPIKNEVKAYAIYEYGYFQDTTLTMQVEEKW